VIFACEKRILGILIKSFIATRGIEAKNLVEIAYSASCSDPLMKNLAVYIRRMHEIGILHVDLKGENLLVDDARDIFLIDLDRLRVRRFLSLNDIIRNLSYLNASFVNTIELSKRLEFLDEYLKGNLKLQKLRHKIIAGIEEYTQERLKKRYY
jgi:tRNA A-37 threonylcarbamoyl transferase component Bud32